MVKLYIYIHCFHRFAHLDFLPIYITVEGFENNQNICEKLICVFIFIYILYILYIYIYILYMYIYIYIYIYCGHSCTWAHDVRFTICLYIMCPSAWARSYYGDNREDILFSWLQIYYAHLAPGRFEHSVCRE